MHELSLAISIVELARQQAVAHQAREVEEVELEIGALAGVEPDTLFFALGSAVKGTLLEHAKIVKHTIEGEGKCSECGAVFRIKTLFDNCPTCKSYFINILKGKELRIKSLVIN